MGGNELHIHIGMNCYKNYTEVIVMIMIVCAVFILKPRFLNIFILQISMSDEMKNNANVIIFG